MWPMRSSTAKKSSTGLNLSMRSPNSPRSSTSASSSITPEAAGNASRSPTPTFFPGLTRARHRLSPAGSVSRTSICPLGCWRSRMTVRCAYKRAGMTRLSLRTSRSPGLNSEGKSAKFASRRAPVARFMTSMRLRPRSAGGCCAINSGGSSKSKSSTRRALMASPRLRVWAGKVDSQGNKNNRRSFDSASLRSGWQHLQREHLLTPDE